MHRLMSYGLLTLVCGAFAPGCGGDTSGERPTTNGSAGNAGGGGSAGQTGGGMAGTSMTGSGGTGGSSTALPPACTGCVELLVNLAPDPMAWNSAQFVIRPATPIDLSTAVLTWKVKSATPADVVPPEQAFVQVFATNGMPNYTGAFVAQTALTPANGFTNADTWVDVVMDFNRVGPTAPAGETPPPAAAADAGADAGATGGGTTPPPAGAPFTVSMIDKTQITQIGIVVGATAAFTSMGYVRVAVDSLSVEGVDMTVLAPRDFNTDAGGLTLNMYQIPQGTVAPVARPAP